MKTSEVFGTIVLIAIVIIYLTIKSKKTKNSSWKGELIKKRDITDEDNENHVYRLIFRINNGKKVKVSVSEEIYNKSQVGDKFEKIKGDYIPKKI